jgi:hypothetical protein
LEYQTPFKVGRIILNSDPRSKSSDRQISPHCKKKIIFPLLPFPHNSRINLGALPMDSPRTHLPIALAIFLTFVCPLLNGSMNFTEVAEEKNAGNPLIIHGENVPGENSPI